VTTNVLVAICTGYCACKTCTPGHGVTASGNTPVAGRTIAGPRIFPLGSTVVIRGHTYTLQDRTALRYDGRFDIYFARHADALKFGRQTNTVTVIGP